MADTLKDWFETFWRILISPTPTTFAQEAEKGTGKITSAILWAIFFAACGYAGGLATGNTFATATLFVVVIVFPLIVLLFSSATHFMLQRVFHKKQYLYDKYLYIYTAIFLLFQFIALPLIFLPPVPILNTANYLIAGYQFLLMIIALQAIAKIQYWQAAVTVLVSALAGIITLICAMPVIYSLMGGVSSTLR